MGHYIVALDGDLSLGVASVIAQMPDQRRGLAAVGDRRAAVAEAAEGLGAVIAIGAGVLNCNFSAFIREPPSTAIEGFLFDIPSF